MCIFKVKYENMRYKFLTVIFLLAFLTNFGQTGIYTSSDFAYRSQKDPSKNRDENTVKTLIVDFDAIGKKYFTWRISDPGDKQDVFLKWNIYSKIDDSYIKERNIKQTVYTAKLEVSGVEQEEIENIYVIFNYNNNTSAFIIYSPKYDVSNIFYDVKKM